MNINAVHAALAGHDIELYGKAARDAGIELQ